MKPARRRVRILLIDDHALFREGMARLLAAEPDLDLVAHCGSGDQALSEVTGGRIDLVLLDLDLGNERGLDVLERVRRAGFDGRVLVLTAGATDADILKLLALGIAGVFHKENSARMLAEGIRAVMRGEALIDQRSLAAIAKLSHASSSEAPTNAFTPRERQVLRSVFDGLANKEIAARLDISESSVKAALQQLFNKTGVRTRSQLVRIVLEQHRGHV